MAAKKIARPPRGNFTLGGEQAEADPLLREGGFFATGSYLAVESRDDRHCFLLGRTGSGKSALLQQLEDTRTHVIRIRPEDLSLTYITDLQVLRYLSSLGVHLDPLFIALWKHVLLIEIIKDRYNVDSGEAKQRFLAALRERIGRDRSKTAALEYLDEFDGRFWCETDERVREITRRFEEQVEAAAGGRLEVLGIGSAGASIGENRSTAVEVRTELADRYQHIVNETQLPRLNKMIDVLDEDILESHHHHTFVVIDDLDRDWIDEQVSNTLVRCLFRAVVDLGRVRNLKVLVALRTNIFQQLDFGLRTGGQEEKFRALALRLRWSRPDLEALLSERAKAAAARYGVDGIRSIRDVLPATNKTRGDPLEFILRRTLMRPRDAVAYFNEAFVLADGRPKLGWNEIHDAERPYSVKRLLALRDEWKPTYPGIGDVFELFNAVPVLLTRVVLADVLDKVALLPAKSDFEGVRWLTPLTEPLWNGLGGDDWVGMYHPVIQFMFTVGFLGCRRSSASHVTFTYDDPDFIDQPSNLERVDAFFVHPAFRAALDIVHLDKSADTVIDVRESAREQAL